MFAAESPGREASEPTFVARVTSSRRPRAANHSPMIDSDAPT